MSVSAAATGRPNSVPAHLPSMVGREQALETVRECLLQVGCGLLTLTGPGGSGKTRLALAVAAEVLDRPEFVDGVWIADLAPLNDPLLIPGAVAASIGVQEQPGRPIRDTLLDALRGRRLLLVLDNCEHLVEASASLTDHVLRACPYVRVLATSREPLRLAVERTWRVPPLSVPDPSRDVTLDELSANASVRLLVERAQAVEPSFALSQQTRLAIVGICTRLDGLPLAIELAAAQARVLTAEQILARLDDAFRLLVSGSRTAPTRHQTLRATLDWSLQTLAPEAQHRFERLAVFAGGFDLEAIEALWSGPPPHAEQEPDALAMLTELADRSLVLSQPEPGGMRYRLLEPVRQYAEHRLIERGDWDASRARHAEYFLALAERSEQGLQGAQQTESVARLHLEHDNLRAVLRRSLDAMNWETALRIASSLPHFWRHAGFRNEGRRWLEESLAQSVDVEPRVRAKALHAAAELAYGQSDFRASRTRFEEAVEAWRSVGDETGVAAVLPQYGRLLARTASNADDYRRAVAVSEEAVALNIELGRRFWAGWALLFLSCTRWEHAELQAAAAGLDQAQDILEALGERHAHGHVVSMQGAVARDQGDLEGAALRIDSSLADSRAIDCVSGTAGSLYHLALLSRRRGDAVLAAHQAAESLLLHHRLRDLPEVASCVELLAGLALDQGHAAHTARLYGGAAALREEVGVLMPPIRWPARDHEVAGARAALSSEQFAAEWEKGERTDVDQLVLYASQLRFERATDRKRAADPLSPREREVITLLARGYTNRQIADDLIISERTADGHVAHILAKLGLATRSQAAVWAVEHAGAGAASGS